MHLKSLVVEVVGVVVLVSHNIVLRNGSETFDSWKKPPLPVYTQFYFFNVTNPEEILNGETPRLEEVGPYTYSCMGNTGSDYICLKCCSWWAHSCE
ncbi:hypothetical protein FD754_018721 [Muntiacus muntjak]|uniref:Uncharacterized protein n=1 Tax=Muntiacus muntjak TaxID=9888 RepID=A0A5N3UYB2_MUNMU|nr:hypothetical protein FD754_018721 [Muntiacus muntjak]